MRRALLLVAAVLGSGCYEMNRVVANDLIARQGKVPRCDAIVVPGCPARPDGQASTCVARRVGAAVAAFRERLASTVVFSGAAVHNPANEAQAMAAYARTLGLPEAAILIEPNARHTAQNLSFTAWLLRPRGMRSVLIVTDAMQLPFAMELAARAGLRPWARLAHRDLPAAEVRDELVLDRYEPVPARWWH